MNDQNTTVATKTEIDPQFGDLLQSIKPGMRTSEFALTMLLVVLGGALASGQIVNNTAVQIAGVAMMLLKSALYTWSRTKVKTTSAPTTSFDAKAWVDDVQKGSYALKTPSAGFVSEELIILLSKIAIALTACAWLLCACAWFKSESKAVAGDVVDCTTSSAASQIREYGPLVDSMLVYATDGGGKINGDAVKAASKGFAMNVGGCVLADSIARALTPKPTDPNAPKASPLEADPDSLRDAIGALYPGKHFKTANGTL